MGAPAAIRVCYERRDELVHLSEGRLSLCRISPDPAQEDKSSVRRKIALWSLRHVERCTTPAAAELQRCLELWCRDGFAPLEQLRELRRGTRLGAASRGRGRREASAVAREQRVHCRNEREPIVRVVLQKRLLRGCRRRPVTGEGGVQSGADGHEGERE